MHKITTKSNKQPSIIVKNIFQDLNHEIFGEKREASRDKNEKKN